MAVPDFQTFFVPVLRAVIDGREYSSSEIREKVAVDLALTPEDLDQRRFGRFSAPALVRYTVLQVTRLAKTV
jgi:hypothetical protein